MTMDMAISFLGATEVTEILRSGHAFDEASGESFSARAATAFDEARLPEQSAWLELAAAAPSDVRTAVMPREDLLDGMRDGYGREICELFRRRDPVVHGGGHPVFMP